MKKELKDGFLAIKGHGVKAYNSFDLPEAFLSNDLRVNATVRV